MVEHESKLYRYSTLEPRKVINDQVQETPLAAVYVPQAACAVAWERRVDGRTLTFEPQLVISEPAGKKGTEELRLADKETGSLWDPLRGQALSGPLRGKQLKPLIAISIRTHRYRGLYPNGEVYTETKP